MHMALTFLLWSLLDEGAKFNQYGMIERGIMIKFSISIFYIVVHNRSFLDILPNFNLLRTLQHAFFEPLFLRI